MTGRFTPVGPGQVEWSVHFDDPDTWEKPWAFAMRLTQVADTEPLRFGTPATKATTRCSTC